MYYLVAGRIITIIGNHANSFYILDPCGRNPGISTSETDTDTSASALLQCFVSLVIDRIWVAGQESHFKSGLATRFVESL